MLLLQNSAERIDTALSLALACVYCLLFIVAIILFWIYFKGGPKSIFFIVSFELGTLGRIAFFILFPFYAYGHLDLRFSAVFLINSLPSFFFLSSYVILLWYWYVTRRKQLNSLSNANLGERSIRHLSLALIVNLTLDLFYLNQARGFTY